ncbi:uncharacterized protein LOC131932356 [Physella acuta]|uniref:uncharacterized protein LOC131932356 n=1 Tax=Physella acuta TaxID=109671 RepID=UPI0027DBB9F0|nr:uncharacterized protein LOC131932356 [Physella acuta]
MINNLIQPQLKENRALSYDHQELVPEFQFFQFPQPTDCDHVTLWSDPTPTSVEFLPETAGDIEITTSSATQPPASTTSASQNHEMPEKFQEFADDGQLGEEVVMHFDPQEEKILAATLKAVQSGSLTPLIKEELRCTIQSRRMAEGKGELKVEFKSPPKKKDMTDDERKRALKRRQQNREAAQRFRQKQKDTSDYLTDKIKRLEKASNNLIIDLRRLKEERDELQAMLKSHLLVCNNNIPTSINVDSNLEVFLQGIPHPTSTCAHHASTNDPCDSCSSVYFSEGDTAATNEDFQVFNGPIDNLEISFEGSTADDVIDVFYEEEVIGEDNLQSTENGFYDNSRIHIDSCSSIGSTSPFGSTSSEHASLSDSAHSHRVISEYSRIHTNSSSSEMCETTDLDEDFLLIDSCMS